MLIAQVAAYGIRKIERILRPEPPLVTKTFSRRCPGKVPYRVCEDLPGKNGEFAWVWRDEIDPRHRLVLDAG